MFFLYVTTCYLNHSHHWAYRTTASPPKPRAKPPATEITTTDNQPTNQPTNQPETIRRRQQQQQQQRRRTTMTTTNDERRTTNDSPLRGNLDQWYCVTLTNRQEQNKPEGEGRTMRDRCNNTCTDAIVKRQAFSTSLGV